VPIVAGDTVEDVILIFEGASDVAALARLLEEDVLENGVGTDEDTIEAAPTKNFVQLFVVVLL
jgi:5S rRNA maturation endonuclease (ribonuclease M5)